MLELLDYVFQKHFPNGGFLLVSLNPQAIAWLKLHPEHIDLEGLALNTHPEAIPLLKCLGVSCNKVIHKLDNG
jgi:hypothetical protein